MPEFWHSALLPHLESRRSCQEVTCYRPHSHDRFSIGLIDSGTTVFSGAAGEALPLVAGDVILIPAGHVHACNPQHGRWTYQMIQADQDWITTLLSDESGSAPAGINVYRHPGLHDRFSAVNDLLFLEADAERIEAEFRRALQDCAGLEPHRRILPTTDAALLTRLGTVIDRLHQDEPTPALDELAEVVGMDKYQLIRAMKQATGLPPLAWRQNDRVIAARAMLRDGRSLADTAHALGFSDQSHFHRVFRAHVAATPGAYRR
ncbi:AraC family transcriptional regulator [Kitasatospora sp. NPDC097691]|uniref:AraC family transcriptional regulator n=1 Tax=Kitasatospora sp. NPDC097691 TaxID=3157231 RepID=UPI003316F303